METPEAIRAQYGSPRGETPEERRRRLANRRAAKYRYFKSLDASQGQLREQNNRRQRDRRRQLDESAKERIREQNRVRQQLRRQTLSDDTRQEVRERQRQRQQMRRTRLDQEARATLRERERLRVRMRRARAARRGSSDAADQDPAERVRDWSSLLAPASPSSPLPASPPMLRLARSSMNASDVLSSAMHHQSIGAIQLPPVLGNSNNNGNISHIVHARSEPELPELQPHLRQIQQQQAHLTFSGFQFSTLPSASSSAPTTMSSNAFSDRVPQLPHLQMALPQAASLLNPSPVAPPPPIFQLAPPPQSSSTSSLPSSSSSGLRGISGPPMSVGGPLPHASSIGMLSMPPPGSLMLPPTQPQQPQMLPSIAIPPQVRALPPLPDFLNSRDSFGSSVATSTSNSGLYFSLMTNDQHASEYQDGGDSIFRG